MSNSLKRFSIGGVTTNLEYNLVPYLIVEITKFLDIKMLDNHIGWLVPSITNASIFFKMIGYNEASDIIYDPIRKINILFIIKESQTIELIEPTTKDSIVYTYLKTRGPGPYHLCLPKEDNETLVKKLSNLKFFPITQNEEAIALKNLNVQFFYNKEIGIIEIAAK